MKPDNVRSEIDQMAFDRGYRAGYADAKRGKFSEETLRAARSSESLANSSWADGYEVGAQAFIFSEPPTWRVRVIEWFVVGAFIVAVAYLVNKLSVF